MTKDLKLEKLAKSLLDNKFVGILVVSDNKIEYANAKAESLFGMEEANLQNENFEDLVDFDQNDNSLKNLIKIGKDVIVRGHVNDKATNQQCPVDFAVSSCERDHIHCIFISSSQDRESFLFLKKQFYKRITHELRSPLSSIIGALALLKSGKLAKIESIVQIAERNAKRLTLMINSILDIEQYEKGKIFLQLRNTDLSQIIGDAINLVDDFVDESKISIDNQAKPIAVNADEERLPQAIAQLFRYFIGHRPGLESVTITVNDGDGWADIKLKLAVSSISDDASNESEELKLIPGLTLDLAKQVIELHNGTVTGMDQNEAWIRLPLSK